MGICYPEQSYIHIYIYVRHIEQIKFLFNLLIHRNDNMTYWWKLIHIANCRVCKSAI